MQKLKSATRLILDVSPALPYHSSQVRSSVHDLLADLFEKRISRFVFPSNRKADEKMLDVKKGFQRAVKIAGIAHVRFHDLWHTFASRLVQAGVDLITVQHLLGHARITMTARYAHSPNSARIEAVARLQNFPASQSFSNRSLDPLPRETETDSKPLQSSTIGP